MTGFGGRPGSEVLGGQPRLIVDFGSVGLADAQARSAALLTDRLLYVAVQCQFNIAVQFQYRIWRMLFCDWG